MTNKREIYMPTDEEDAEINRGIAADPDTFEVSEAQFAQMRRLGDGLRADSFKILLTIHYDVDIVERFQAMGNDWQTRMNDALREWLNLHSPA